MVEGNRKPSETNFLSVKRLLIPELSNNLTSVLFFMSYSAGGSLARDKYGDSDGLPNEKMRWISGVSAQQDSVFQLLQSS